MTNLPSLSLPFFVISKASSASVNLNVWVNSGFKSTKPLATRSIDWGLELVSVDASRAWGFCDSLVTVSVSTARMMSASSESWTFCRRSCSPPSTLEGDLVGGQPEQWDLDVWGAESGLHTSSTIPAVKVCSLPIHASLYSPRSDSVDTHLNADLCTRGVHDKIDGARSSGGSACLNEKVGSGSKRVFRSRLIRILFCLRRVQHGLRTGERGRTGI